jgi:hypothetical protein
MMRIEVGPCPADSVLAWTGQARAVLELVRTRTIVLPFALPDDVLQSYTATLDEWDELASSTDPFVWAGDLEPATVRHLVQYWVNLVQYLVENADGSTIPLMPLEGLPFRDVLIPAITSALAAEPDETTHRFGELTSDQWPGLRVTSYPYGKAGAPTD